MKIGIVGIGLIGASLGWDFRQMGHQVFGVSRQQTTCEIAEREGICDRASCQLADLKDTEIIFICTPIAAIIPTIEQLIPHLSPELYNYYRCRLCQGSNRRSSDRFVAKFCGRTPHGWQL